MNTPEGPLPTSLSLYEDDRIALRKAAAFLAAHKIKTEDRKLIRAALRLMPLDKTLIEGFLVVSGRDQPKENRILTTWTRYPEDSDFIRAADAFLASHNYKASDTKIIRTAFHLIPLDDRLIDVYRLIVEQNPRAKRRTKAEIEEQKRGESRSSPL